jgi:hypothetical protein
MITFVDFNHDESGGEGCHTDALDGVVDARSFELLLRRCGRLEDEYRLGLKKESG